MNKAITCILDIGAIIVPDDFNARKNFDPEFLIKLEENITQQGQLMPIIVNKVDGKLYLVAGEQRLRAMKEGGESFVEAKVCEGLDYKASLRLSLTENVCRRPLNKIEEAIGMSKMLDAGFTIETVANDFNYKRDVVCQRLKLLTLPSEIQKMVIRDTFPLPVHQALVLAKLNERTSEQLELARRAAPSVGPVASEAQVREWVDELLGKKLPFDNDDDNGGDGDEPEETVKTPTAADKPQRERKLREDNNPLPPIQDENDDVLGPFKATVILSGNVKLVGPAVGIENVHMTIINEDKEVQADDEYIELNHFDTKTIDALRPWFKNLVKAAQKPKAKKRGRKSKK